MLLRLDHCCGRWSWHVSALPATAVVQSKIHWSNLWIYTVWFAKVDAADVKLPDDNQRVSNLVFKVTRIIHIVDEQCLLEEMCQILPVERYWLKLMSERSDPLLNGSQKITLWTEIENRSHEIELQILFTNKVFPSSSTFMKMYLL